MARLIHFSGGKLVISRCFVIASEIFAKIHDFNNNKFNVHDTRTIKQQVAWRNIINNYISHQGGQYDFLLVFFFVFLFFLLGSQILVSLD